jgi:hypothetical protein
MQDLHLSGGGLSGRGEGWWMVVEGLEAAVGFLLYVDPNYKRRLTTEQSEACCQEAWGEAKRRR